jgi:hypothetical protein
VLTYESPIVVEGSRGLGKAAHFTLLSHFLLAQRSLSSDVSFASGDEEVGREEHVGRDIDKFATPGAVNVPPIIGVSHVIWLVTMLVAASLIDLGEMGMLD